MVYALTEYEFLVPQACNLIRKETLALVFSCEFSKISKSTFFVEHLQATASMLGNSIENMHGVVHLLRMSFSW